MSHSPSSAFDNMTELAASPSALALRLDYPTGAV
jgi:hypothetical protein